MAITKQGDVTGFKPRMSVTRMVAGGLGLAASAYAGYVAAAWYRFGADKLPGSRDSDQVLDRFIPTYDIVEQHQVRVAAPAAITLATAKEMDLWRTPLVRAIFRAREIIFGTQPPERRISRGIVAETRALGWGVLEERADREIALGAVTRPWEPNVTFRSVAPELFAAFAEPAYVKIAWMLRADPIDDHTSTFRTETRAIATDEYARRKFRLYWSFAPPGIALIRRLSLAPIKAEAERRVLKATLTARSKPAVRFADRNASRR